MIGKLQNVGPIRWVGLTTLGLALALTASCRPQAGGGWREYDQVREVATAPAAPSPGMGMPPSGESGPPSLAWKAPEGWQAQGASGMRLESFTVTSGSETGLCTLVMLGGMAGGVEPNIQRWIGQLGLAPPAPDAFAAFMQKQDRFTSEGGFEVVVADLTDLSPADAKESMLGAVVKVGGSTLFVKFTGPPALLRAGKESFKSLCQSIRKP